MLRGRLCKPAPAPKETLPEHLDGRAGLLGAGSIHPRAGGRARPRRARCAAAVMASGWAGGLFVVTAAWMVLGWLFVMDLNQWPQVVQRTAGRWGVGAIAACVVMALTRFH